MGNCLLFYCSCTGNCENCCGINGSIKDKIESESQINNDNNNIKDNKVEKKIEEEEKKEENKEDNKIENEKKDNKKKEEEKKIDNNKEEEEEEEEDDEEEEEEEEGKEEKKNENKIGDNSEIKLKEFTIAANGKINNIQIVNAEFAKEKLVNASVYNGSSDNYEAAKKEFLNGINKTGGKYLSAYVEVKKNENVVGYFIHCTNANIKNLNGLFYKSEATKIVILRCGNNVTNMSNMFSNCTRLTKIIFSDNLNTNTVKNMRGMFYYCSSLTNLDLSNFNTDNVTDMYSMFDNCNSLKELKISSFNTNNVKNMCWMFNNCSSLKELNLSSFNTSKVGNMFGMFFGCFKNEATLICTASTIKKITENENSYLTIPNENKNEIKKTLNENLDQVYTCSVKRVGDNPEITAVEEYQQQ